MVMKKSSRGSISRAIRQSERYATDKEFREKEKEYRMNYYHKNREKELSNSL